MAKILICIPSMDMVATGFCQSLAMLQKAGHEVSIMFQVGSLIYDARNRLAKQAIKMGADGIETDVQLTKDGTLVLAHDESIERVSDGSGWIKDYTLQELRGFSFSKTHPEFGTAMQEAAEAGVEILFLPCHVETDQLTVI